MLIRNPLLIHNPLARAVRASVLRVAIGLAVVGWAVALPSSKAIAAPREPSDTAVEEAAKARYTEGLRLYNKRRYEEARAAFLQSTALKRRPAATLMLAQSCLKAGRWLEASRAFDAYLAEVGGSSELPPKLRDIVENGRRDTRARLGRMRFDVPEGSEVTIDGERVSGPLDAPIDVMPGSHTVTVGHRDEKKTETVEVSQGATVDVKPAFVPKPLVPTSDTRTRPTPSPPPRRATDTSETTPETSGPSLLAPPETIWPVYVAGVIGLGGLAAAAIFGGLHANSSHGVEVATQTLTRNGKSVQSCASGTGWATADGQAEPDEQAKYSETCISLAKNERLARDHQQNFGISLAVGLSGTAIAAAWYLVAAKERGEKPTTEGKPLVIPWASPGGGGGATVQGRF